MVWKILLSLDDDVSKFPSCQTKTVVATLPLGRHKQETGLDVCLEFGIFVIILIIIKIIVIITLAIPDPSDEWILEMTYLFRHN